MARSSSKRNRGSRRRGRKRNSPSRTTGALIVNPRRRNSRKSRRSRSGRKRNTLWVKNSRGKRGRKRNIKIKRSNRGHRRGKRGRRSNGGRGRKRNALYVKNRGSRSRRGSRGRGRKRNALYVKNRGSRSRRGRRSNRGGGVRVAYRRNRGSRGRRRNSSGSGMFGGLSRMFAKIPLVGGFLSGALGFVPFAVGGAVGVEPTMQLASFLAPYLPSIPSSLYYAVVSLVVAAVTSKYAPVAPATREKLAIAIASAGGGVAYYKWRTGQDAELESEAGFLQYSGVSAFGDGFQTAIVPFAEAGMGSGASPGDAAYAGLTTAYETQAALAGPAFWRRAFPRFGRRHRGFGPSQYAGKHGHRHRWLIAMIGFADFQRFVQLPPEQQQVVLARARAAAAGQVQAALAGMPTAPGVGLPVGTPGLEQAPYYDVSPGGLPPSAESSYAPPLGMGATIYGV